MPAPARAPAADDSSSEEGGDDERGRAVRERISSVLDEYGLSQLGRTVVAVHLRKVDEPDYDRFRGWWFAKLNGRRVEPADPRQRGCPERLPGLRSKPFWDDARDVFPWIAELEAHADAIRDELLALRGSERTFQPYRAPSWAGKTQADDGVGSVSTDLSLIHI